MCKQKQMKKRKGLKLHGEREEQIHHEKRRNSDEK
jgi:hypothetical protein